MGHRSQTDTIKLRRRTFISGWGQFSLVSIFPLEMNIATGGPGAAGSHCAAMREISLNNEAGVQGSRLERERPSILEDIIDAMTTSHAYSLSYS